MAEERDNPKGFVNEFCQKNKIMPEFHVRSAGIKNRQRFICELTVPGHPYVALGNSLNKKDAEKNAARDFIQYLLRTQAVNQNDVPRELLRATPGNTMESNSGPPSLMSFSPSTSRPVFKAGEGPGDYGQAYRGRDGSLPFSFMDTKKVEEAEESDFNSALHGNWTIENAKARLHQFMQMNKIHAEYRYQPVGPDNSRTFRADMSLYIPQLGREIRGSETGSTKQTASKSCALSLVRQLFHLRVIDAFTGSMKLKDTESINPFQVTTNPSAMSNLYAYLEEKNISIPLDESSLNSLAADGSNGNKDPITLLSEAKKKAFVFDDTDKSKGIVSWSPPMPNWNPWTNCNIDEGYMATASLEDLSSGFLESFRQQQMDNHVQKMNQCRNALPVFSSKSQILEAIGENQIILIKGETGSGKTTQICQFILDEYIMSGQGAYCNVLVTQPRRISAISLAERIANERGEELGATVGYSVRFESALPRPYASILLCTVGVLLRKLEGGLRGVSHVIIDEIHERDINTDFLLIVIRDMLSMYEDLRVILMSATIDTKLFCDYFNSCPVVEVPGKTFPVDVYYLEDIVEELGFRVSADYIKRAKKKRQEDGEEDGMMEEEKNLNFVSNGEANYSPTTHETLRQLPEREVVHLELLVALLQRIKTMEIPGAILVFLPGWNNIFTILKYLQEHPVFGSSSYVLLPLHSQLPREDQHRVFQSFPPNVTKVILSTNIAETSITIDDVAFVIDSCKAKMKLFTSHNNMTTFATVWASKSNVLQRTGRAGRVKKGVCFRLCTKARFESMEENLKPEMLRTPLHEIALSIKLLRLGAIGHFLSKAPEPPPIDTVIEAQALLTEIRCLDENANLTALGRILAKMPVDPRLGKMIVAGAIFNCADPLAIIAAQSANLSEIFNLGPNNKRLTPQQRSFAAHRHSDHYAILNAFQQWEYHKRHGEQAELEFCTQRMLSLNSLRSTHDAKAQLIQVLIECGFPEEQVLPNKISFRDSSPVLDIIAGLLCHGLYPNVCYHKDKRKVLTTEAKPALVHKASVNCSRFEITFPYPFFIFGEKIRTRAVACKQMTMVTPIHLLLFGCRKVEYVDNMIRLDNWINLVMPPKEAAAIIALRPTFEDLIVRVSENPESFFPIQEEDMKLLSTITELCRIENVGGSTAESNAPRSFFSGNTTFSSNPGGRNPSEDSRGPIKREFDDSTDYDEASSNKFQRLDSDSYESEFSSSGAEPTRGFGFRSGRPHQFHGGYGGRGNWSNRPRRPHRGWSPRTSTGGRGFRNPAFRGSGARGFFRPSGQY